MGLMDRRFGRRLGRGLGRGLAALAALLAAAGCAGPGEEGVFTGYVEAELVYVAAPEAGWLVAEPPAEGTAVAAGDPLFRLDADSQEAALEEARQKLRQAAAEARDLEKGARKEEIEALEAQKDEALATLELARRERDRFAKLTERGAAAESRRDQTAADFETAQARLERITAEIATARLAGREARREAADAARDAAKAAVAQAEWRLGQRRVAARVGGRVEEVFRHEGEFAAAGAPVLSLLPPDALKLRFFVPQAALSSIALGAEAVATTDGGAEERARISFIATEAEFTPPVIFSEENRAKLVFMVEARLEKGTRLRPGQPVDVRLAAPGPQISEAR